MKLQNGQYYKEWNQIVFGIPWSKHITAGLTMNPQIWIQYKRHAQYQVLCVGLTLYSKTQGKYSVRRVVVLVDPGPWGRRWSVTQGSGRQPTPDALFSGSPNTMLDPPLMMGLIQYHHGTDCRPTKSSFYSLLILPTPYVVCNPVCTVVQPYMVC